MTEIPSSDPQPTAAAALNVDRSQIKQWTELDPAHRMPLQRLDAGPIPMPFDDNK